MCTTCGCGGESKHVLLSEDEDESGVGHVRGRRERVGQGWVREVRTVRLQRELLNRNNLIASQTRRVLDEIGVSMFNLIGAPGAGKTSLLEATIRALGAGDVPLAVIEGDPSNDLDARRIEAVGGSVLQINTGAGCHLDSSMVAEALGALTPKPGSVVFVENVGNLVCPALFDLGELSKVVVMSVAQGEDEPLKYSHVFRAADLFVLTKTDLLPHVTFDEERCLANARKVNPGLCVLRASTVHVGGVDEWCDWVKRRARE
jgi:hydrogenase nickel incorporation protein HypB